MSKNKSTTKIQQIHYCHRPVLLASFVCTLLNQLLQVILPSEQLRQLPTARVGVRAEENIANVALRLKVKAAPSRQTGNKLGQEIAAALWLGEVDQQAGDAAADHVHEAGKGLYGEGGAHDDQQVTLGKVVFNERVEAVGEHLAVEDDVRLHVRATGIAAGDIVFAVFGQDDFYFGDRKNKKLEDAKKKLLPLLFIHSSE